MERRAQDERITRLEVCMQDLQEKMAKNTEITEQVRDIVSSFKLIYRVAKWLTAVGAALTAFWHGFLFIRGQ